MRGPHTKPHNLFWQVLYFGAWIFCRRIPSWSIIFRLPKLQSPPKQNLHFKHKCDQHKHITIIYQGQSAESQMTTNMYINILSLRTLTLMPLHSESAPITKLQHCCCWSYRTSLTSSCICSQNHTSLISLFIASLNHLVWRHGTRPAVSPVLMGLNPWYV